MIAGHTLDKERNEFDTAFRELESACFGEPYLERELGESVSVLYLSPTHALFQSIFLSCKVTADFLRLPFLAGSGFPSF